FLVFFFQAEDGIRDFHVTGVQTCALPICRTVEAFAGYAVQVVIGPGQEELAAAALTGLALPAPVTGGATRQESVRRGLEALAKQIGRASCRERGEVREVGVVGLQ